MAQGRTAFEVRIRRLVRFYATLTVIAILTATTYGLFSVLGKVPASMPLFFTWSGIMSVPLFLWSWYFWRNRHLFRIGTQIAFMLWSGVGFWYWTLAPVYHFSNQEMNSIQMGVVMFAYFWETPGVGGVTFAGGGYLLFRRFRDYLEGRFKPANPEKFYRGLLRYPLFIIAWTFVNSTLAYVIGIVQQNYWGEMAYIERWKLGANGFALATFLSITYYLLLDILLNDIRKKFQKDYPSLQITKRRLTRKVAGVSIFVAAGTITLVGLIAFRFFQDIIKENIEIHMEERIPIAAEEFRNAQTSAEELRALEILQYGERGRVFFLPVQKLDSSSEFSKETLQFLKENETGTIGDLRREIKLVSFFKTPDKDRIGISIVELPEFYIPFIQPINLFIFGVVLILLVTVLVSIFISIIITRSIRTLSSSIQAISPQSKFLPAPIYTGDEIQGLSQTLSNYIEQVQNMEKTKNDFILLASHQLRTPPTMIRGSAEVLLAEGNANLTPEQKDHVERIYRNNQRSIDLINTLIEASGMELGVLRIDLIPVEMISLVKSILDELKPQTSEKEIGIQEVYAEGIPEITADPKLLRMIFHNVISNAFNYTPAGGKVGIRITTHKKDGVIGGKRLPEDSVVVAISDTGGGISAEDQKRLFTKFFRSDVAKRQYTSGSGLGLYMTKAIIDRVGGSIWFESEENKGTTFYVAIPLSGMRSNPTVKSPA